MGRISPKREQPMDPGRRKNLLHGVHSISREPSAGMGAHTHEVFGAGNSGTEHSDHCIPV